MAKKLNLFRMAAVLLLISPALAWDWPAHEYAAREICNYTGCGNCMLEMTNGSIAPDRDFKDTINHHCYEIVQNCPPGNWTCPNKTDCPALEKADEWLQKAALDTGCNESYDVGVASHYFLDSKVFWHTVSNEDYQHCHAEFEHDVGLQIESDFSLSVCGIGITKADFEGFVHDFENEVSSTQTPPASDPALSSIRSFISSIIDFIVKALANLLKLR